MIITQSYIERVLINSEEHPVFSSEWKGYRSHDFGEQFLPKAPVYDSERFQVYDAGELISVIANKVGAKGFFGIEPSRVSLFSYHKESLAASSVKKIQILKDELILMVKINSEVDAEVKFLLGGNLKSKMNKLLQQNHITQSIDQLLATTYNFQTGELRKAFKEKTSEHTLLDFTLQTFGVETVTFSVADFNKMVEKSLENKVLKVGEVDGVDFDAGSIRNSNPNAWAHGDIEQRAFKGIFTHSEFLKIYFGNWISDYSSVISGTTVGFNLKDRDTFTNVPPYKDDAFVIKNRWAFSVKLSHETWYQIIKVLAAKVFIYNQASKPNENFNENVSKVVADYKITKNRIGFYRPEEHIDNPKGLPDESMLSNALLEDPVIYTNGNLKVQKLYAGPAITSFEVNPKTMMKRYIKDDTDGAHQSSFGFFADRMRLAKKEGKTTMGMRHFGAAMHVLEDFYAHTNFIEIELIKLGNLNVNPWVDMAIDVKNETNGKKKACKIHLVTGTFGQSDMVASMAPKIKNEFFSLYQPYKKLKRGDRSVKDLLIFLVLDDYIAKEQGLDESQKFKTTLAGTQMGYVALKASYIIYLEMVDQSRDIENTPLIGEVITAVKFAMDLAVQVNAFLPTFIIRRVLDSVDDRIKQGQTSSGALGTNPTHTQIAKDAADHPLNDAAGYIAYLAVRKMGELMKECWAGVAGRTIESLIERANTRYFVHPCDADWVDEHMREWLQKKGSKSKVEKAKGSATYNHGLSQHEELKKELDELS